MFTAARTVQARGLQCGVVRCQAVASQLRASVTSLCSRWDGDSGTRGVPRTPAHTRRLHSARCVGALAPGSLAHRRIGATHMTDSGVQVWTGPNSVPLRAWPGGRAVHTAACHVAGAIGKGPRAGGGSDGSDSGDAAAGQEKPQRLTGQALMEERHRVVAERLWQARAKAGNISGDALTRGRGGGKFNINRVPEPVIDRPSDSADVAGSAQREVDASSDARFEGSLPRVDRAAPPAERVPVGMQELGAAALKELQRAIFERRTGDAIESTLLCVRCVWVQRVARPSDAPRVLRRCVCAVLEDMRDEQYLPHPYHVKLVVEACIDEKRLAEAEYLVEVRAVHRHGVPCARVHLLTRLRACHPVCVTGDAYEWRRA